MTPVEALRAMIQHHHYDIMHCTRARWGQCDIEDQATTSIANPPPAPADSALDTRKELLRIFDLAEDRPDIREVARAALASPDTAPSEEGLREALERLIRAADNDRTLRYQSVELNDAFRLAKDALAASPDTAPSEEAYCCPCCDAPPGHKPCPPRPAPLHAPELDMERLARAVYSIWPGLAQGYVERIAAAYASQSVSESATEEKT